MPKRLDCCVLSAALAFSGAVAGSQQNAVAGSSQNDMLGLRHGSYVIASVACKDAAFAAMVEWDGVGLSDPHSSQCRSRIVERSEKGILLSTACSAQGDGTPLPAAAAAKPFESRIKVTSATGFQMSNVTADPQEKSVTAYRWCGPK